jgi:hypothetical protein
MPHFKLVRSAVGALLAIGLAPEKLRPWDFGTGLALRDWLEGRRA